MHWADHLAHATHGRSLVRLLPWPRRHRHADQERVFALPIANPARVEDHVAVDHFARQRIGPEPDMANVELVVIQRNVQ